MTFKQEIKQIVNKYGLQKNTDNNWLSNYTYKIHLNNINTDWYVIFEDKTRKCKFYSVFTRFTDLNEEQLREIQKVMKDVNTYSGKCNAFCYTIDEINCFINNVIIFDKLYNV